MRSQELGKLKHGVGCRHLRLHKPTLVGWKGDMACKQVIYRVEVEAWENIVTTEMMEHCMAGIAFYYTKSS